AAHRPAHRAARHRARIRLPRQDRRRRRLRRRGKGVIVATLEIRDLHVSVEESVGVHREILRGVNLTVREGETHALMGPNGSGKSTMAYAIAGHPKYLVTNGSVTLDGEDVLAMTVDSRARAGLFLAMQYPVEVPGVSVSNFLRTAVTAVRGEAPKLRDFVKELRGAMAALSIDSAFAERNLNEGFSGGEKKRHEILQLELLDPKIAVLDETDSGLDIDALKVVSEGINRFRAKPGRGVLLITHYTRILRYVRPDFVHVFVGGRIVEEAGPSWARCWKTRATSGSPERGPQHEPGGGAYPEGLPHPGQDGPGRAAAGLPRQREHVAEAASGDRHAERVLRAAQREHSPGHARARRRGDRRLRGRAGEDRAVHRHRGRDRDHLHQERFRGHQPGRLLTGECNSPFPAARAAGRR